MFLALGVSEAIASANTVFVDNSTNPPSLSIEGNEENDGLGLIVTKWGSWTNITAKSDNKVADITGLNFYSESQDNTLEVLGDTNIHLVGIAEDNRQAGNVQGIAFSQGKNHKAISAKFNNVTIYAESKDPQFSRAKGLYLGGLHSINPGEDESVSKHPTVVVDGNVDITAKSLGVAIGINVGDELGDANVHGGGHLELHGSENKIYIEQTGSHNVGGYLRSSAGILVSNNASVEIDSQKTTITTVTNHAGQASIIQGGIILDRSATFSSKGELVVDSTVTGGTKSNTLHGISADYFASYLYNSQKGSEVKLEGPVSVILNTNAKTTAYGIASYGKSSIDVNGSVDINLNTNTTSNPGVSKFVAIHSGMTYTYIPSSTPKLNGGDVTINGCVVITLPDDVKPGQNNIIALNAEGLASQTPDHNPSIVAHGGTDDVFKINGNLYAKCKGSIDLKLANEQSYITGWATNNSQNEKYLGTIDISLENGAAWNVVSTLNKSGDKVLDSQ